MWPALSGTTARRTWVAGDILDYDEVVAAFGRTLDWLARTYVDAFYVIHYMHDKYAYERLEMALHDYPVRRFLATGIAGLSVAVDSLSAIRYAQVKVRRDATGLAVDFAVDGEFPCYGNNDDRADKIATWLVSEFMERVRRQPAYQGAEPTLSVLTITSNVVYGKHTGNTPDGRRAVPRRRWVTYSVTSPSTPQLLRSTRASSKGERLSEQDLRLWIRVGSVLHG